MANTQFTPRQTCDDCNVTWDLKRDVVLCTKHAATDDLLEALERVAGYCLGAAITGQEYDGSPFGPEAKRYFQDVSNTARAAINKARGS